MMQNKYFVRIENQFGLDSVHSVKVSTDIFSVFCVFVFSLQTRIVHRVKVIEDYVDMNQKCEHRKPCLSFKGIYIRLAFPIISNLSHAHKLHSRLSVVNARDVKWYTYT